MLKILEYSKFKNERKYGFKKYTSRVQVNMMSYNGFTYIGESEPNWDYVNERYTETSRNVAEAFAEAYKIKKGLIVFYNCKDGWACRHVMVFYRETEKRTN